MKCRLLASLQALVTVTAVAALAWIPVAAQAPPAAAPSAAANDWTPPRTPWGEPDLQGIWTNATTTPLQRPDALAGRTLLTDEERSELDQEAAAHITDSPPLRPGETGHYNNTWLEKGKRSKQTSLIVDPPDGKLPPLTPQAQKRAKSLATARQRPRASWEDANLYERCITRGMPGTMMPAFYNHNYHILQIPGYVVVLIEMIHDVRIIPLDGRPHLSPNIRQWLGDSRGHWDGNTLVVETTNFNDKVNELRTSAAVFGPSGNLHLVERFTRLGPDTIDYQFTVTDPATFTKPWTAAAPMTLTAGPIFEYACHEGNYSIPNILRGARAQENAGEQFHVYAPDEIIGGR